MKIQKKWTMVLAMVIILVLVVVIITSIRAIWKKQQLDKLKDNLLGDYHIEEITYLSLLSSQSLDYVEKKYVGKQVSIKEDGLIFGDNVEVKNDKFFVNEMTSTDWKEYHDKYDISVGENKNTTVFNDKFTYYKAVIGKYNFIFCEKEIYMLDNLTIFKLKKDK